MKTLTLTLISLLFATMSYAGEFDWGHDSYTQYQYDKQAQYDAYQQQYTTQQSSPFSSGASTYRAPAVTTMFGWKDMED